MGEGITLTFTLPRPLSPMVCMTSAERKIVEEHNVEKARLKNQKSKGKMSNAENSKEKE